MPKSPLIDFKAVKTAITMEQLLRRYGVLDQFTRQKDSLSGPCPIHKGSNPTQFRVSLSKNIWNCFSECKNGGNVLDFISRMEDLSIHAAALKAIEWFHLDLESVARRKDTETVNAADEAHQEPAPRKNAVPEVPPRTDSETSGTNPPLKFRLEKLDREHPYLKERGLTAETIAEFGIGHCQKGTMAGRIAIPIQNPEGDVVAYAGRVIGTPEGDIAKYKLPQGFKKSLELFNVHRAIKEPVEAPLVIVEGFFGCMTLHQHGCRKVVGLMGSTMSVAQEMLIRLHCGPTSCIIVMLDDDEAGRAGREDLLLRIAKFAFVKAYTFSREGMQPEDLSAEAVAAMFS